MSTTYSAASHSQRSHTKNPTCSTLSKAFFPLGSFFFMCYQIAAFFFVCFNKKWQNLHPKSLKGSQSFPPFSISVYTHTTKPKPARKRNPASYAWDEARSELREPFLCCLLSDMILRECENLAWHARKKENGPLLELASGFPCPPPPSLQGNSPSRKLKCPAPWYWVGPFRGKRSLLPLPVVISPI